MIWLIVIPVMLAMLAIILGLLAFLFVIIPSMAWTAWKEAKKR